MEANELPAWVDVMDLTLWLRQQGWPVMGRPKSSLLEKPTVGKPRLIPQPKLFQKNTHVTEHKVTTCVTL